MVCALGPRARTAALRAGLHRAHGPALHRRALPQPRARDKPVDPCALRAASPSISPRVPFSTALNSTRSSDWSCITCKALLPAAAAVAHAQQRLDPACAPHSASVPGREGPEAVAPLSTARTCPASGPLAAHAQDPTF
ncbi:hypothetical protein WOLCODRAFT_164283 [Wolfiporia cocos MD-104 SS10]|uniref:Uncharacterized protein n=1 Tax=Wolfiporia cocos (strain MD-104) TaxID=742152 RepID=A0A2H3JT68_WOLCO|nr:hypothetical protein WOLCODRAFT_164283 [Wolfiporia cocos MD-104 SS10]